MTIWGGAADVPEFGDRTVKIRAGSELKDPAAAAARNGKIYFFYYAADRAIEDQIEIVPK